MSDKNTISAQNSSFSHYKGSLSNSDIVPLDDEKDLYAALNRILDSKNEQIILNEEKQESKFIENSSENSQSFINKIDESSEKINPVQNQSLMSNINEILSLINKDENLNFSNISMMNLPEESIQNLEGSFEGKTHNFEEITNHISDTLKELQNQISLTKIPTFTKEESPFTTPKPTKTLSQINNNSTLAQKNEQNKPNLKQILKKIGLKKLLPFQEICMEKIKSHISSLVALPSGCGKSMIYQILSFILEGLIIVVTDKQNFLKKKLNKINYFISWGAINCEMSVQHQQQVLYLAKEKKIKLLFLTPEIFYMSYAQIFSIISLVVIENPSIDEFQKNMELLNVFKENTFTKLVLCPLLRQQEVKCFKDYFQISEIIPKNIDLLQIEKPLLQNFLFESSRYTLNCSGKKSSFFLNMTTPLKEDVLSENSFNFDNVKWVKEEEKNKFLSKFFKNNKKMTCVILCNTKKSADSLSIFLNQQGFHAMRYANDSYKNDKILIGISGCFIDINIKGMIDHVIHYEFPLDLSNYVEDVANYSKNCNFIGLLSDNDYFTHRNYLLASMIQKTSIEQFFCNYLLESNKENISTNKFANINMAKEKLFSKSINLKLNEIAIDLDLKIESLNKIIDLLKEKQIMRFIMRKILKVSLSFKKKIEDAIENSFVLKSIFFHSVNKNGKFRFYLEDIERVNHSTNEMILLELEKCKSNNLITFEILEESYIFEINDNFENEEQFLIDFVFEDFQMSILKNVEKIDVIYCILKSAIEAEAKNKTNISEKESSKNCIEKSPKLVYFLQKYLQNNTELSFQSFDKSNLKLLLPFQKNKIQKEKILIKRDARELFETYFFEITGINRSFSKSVLNINKYEIWVTTILNVFFGLHSQSSNQFSNLWKGTKFWKKYSKYDYNEMKEIILEALRNEQINIGEKTPSKKNSNVFVQRCIQNKKIKIF